MSYGRIKRLQNINAAEYWVDMPIPLTRPWDPASGHRAGRDPTRERPYYVLVAERVPDPFPRTLLVFGFVKGRFTGTKPLRSALQTALIGSAAAGAAFAIARAIS